MTVSIYATLSSLPFLSSTQTFLSLLAYRIILLSHPPSTLAVIAIFKPYILALQFSQLGRFLRVVRFPSMKSVFVYFGRFHIGFQFHRHRSSRHTRIIWVSQPGVGPRRSLEALNILPLAPLIHSALPTRLCASWRQVLISYTEGKNASSVAKR